MNSLDCQTAEQGICAADNDWASQRAVRIASGDLQGDRPYFDRESGLYIISPGICTGPFIRAYNNRIAELMARHGLQDWLPGTRKPRKNLAADWSKHATNLRPTSEVKAERRAIRQMVERIEQRQGSATFKSYRCNDRKLLCFFYLRDSTHSVCLILDLLYCHWLAEYHYSKRRDPVYYWPKSSL